MNHEHNINSGVAIGLFLLSKDTKHAKPHQATALKTPSSLGTGQILRVVEIFPKQGDRVLDWVAFLFYIVQD